MRTPTSWWDKALLEEDPFASIFLVRKFSRGRRNDNWIKELVQDIQGNPVQLASATQWIAYAFAPEGNPTQAAGRLPGAKKVRGLLDFVEVFVRFYWSWYNIDDRAALATVNQQRKLRGFGTLLVPPKLNVENGGPGSNNAAATEYSPAAEPVQTSACRSTLAPQGPSALEDEPNVSRRVRDVAQVDVGTSSSQGQNDMARMIELRTSHDVATETSGATAPTEDSEAMALTTDEDCLTQSALTPQVVFLVSLIPPTYLIYVLVEPRSKRSLPTPAAYRPASLVR
ncbi:hypothetical protein C2E23DRAFT_33632 [Lenzites betulinus]|nr:hypothetical protein C2E23DRAFT_33632 [Lenzites betulinus]